MLGTLGVRETLVIDQQPEQVFLVLVEGVEAARKVVGSDGRMQIGLGAGVVGRLVPGGGNREVGIGRIVVRLVEVVEGREFERCLR